MTLSSCNLSTTSFRKVIRLFNESRSVSLIFGKASLSGTPGKPAPVPTSMTLTASVLIAAASGAADISDRLSAKCFRANSNSRRKL